MGAETQVLDVGQDLQRSRSNETNTLSKFHKYQFYWSV